MQVSRPRNQNSARQIKCVASVRRAFSYSNGQDSDPAGRLVAVFYVPAADGKRILPGMAVEVVPGTVKREESGFICGRVRHVADTPSSTLGMMWASRNDRLISPVKRAAGGGDRAEDDGRRRLSLVQPQPARRRDQRGRNAVQRRDHRPPDAPGRPCDPRADGLF